ncbi:nonstructural protein [Yokapox virus]|uniref:Nonstructural protein n=1 Tax=Yokapox virus TaxID=1076255 RepID=G3EI06_9POXV|nr:nonstructural protein [Yokapox virus]AEN03703.1 nonstructural protein [Yokapox virus]
MTAVPVTDIQNDLITEFSEDNYPSNKNYEITLRQMSILTHVNNIVDKEQRNIISPEEISSEINDDLFPDDSSPATIIERVQTPQTTIIDDIPPPTFRRELLISEQRDQHEKRLNIMLSKNTDTVYESRSIITSMPTQTPSLGVVYDKDKRIQMLEDEVINMRNKKSNTTSSDNLENFTKILFGKTPKDSEINKRIAIVNYANLNGSPLSVEDLEVCSEEEIDKIYKTIKQYHESRKRKIIVTNVIIIAINIIEQVLIKLGFEEIKGLSTDITSEIIDVEIGDDCDAVASKLGIGNSPVLNITLFIIKLFIRRIRII